MSVDDKIRPLQQPGRRFCLSNELLNDQPIFSNRTCYYLASADPILHHAGLIIPYRHSAAPFELAADEWRDTFDLLDRARSHLSVAKPNGYTIGWNVGAVGGQIVGHTHLHIIARFTDEPLAGQGLRHHLKQNSNRRRPKD